MREESLDQYVSADELAPLLERSDFRAWLMVASNFLIIAVAFTLPALWLNPLTVILAILLIGGRQLGLAVLYHDCAHSVLFRTRRLNDFLGTWLFGGLMNTSLLAYRNYHLGHHRYAGTEQDPDLQLASAYPASRDSMKRKLLRDATGQTGFKDIKNQLKRFGVRRNAPFLLSHGLLLGALALAGIAWTYVLWWAAFLFAYQVITRVRFMSEHGVALDRLSTDVRDNTCTTVARWWERLFIGPNFVNYHLEHHLKAGVPCYHLPRFHTLLRDRGYFDDRNCLTQGYREVLRKATRPEPLPA